MDTFSEKDVATNDSEDDLYLQEKNYVTRRFLVSCFGVQTADFFAQNVITKQSTHSIFFIIWIPHWFVVGALCALSDYISWSKFLYEADRILRLCVCKYSWSIGLQIVILDTHGVHCLFSCLTQFEFWACANILHQLDCRLFSRTCMGCTVCFISWWKFFAWGRWNF